MRFTHLVLLAGVAASMGCSDDGPGVVDARRQGDATFVASSEALGALRQEIRLSPAEPRQGDTLRITSVVRNTGIGSPTVDARTCGLDLRGELSLRDPYFRCGGYSMNQHPLSPGDSITESDGGIVLSKAGRHELQVRHLLIPEVWVRVPVVVR